MLGWLWVAPLLAWIGRDLLFTSFMLYDDEGYILLSLRNFAEHGGLYDKVYSQYGPFFYAALDSLRAALGFAWDNTSARWFTLFNWVCASLLCGLLVWRVRRLASAALFSAVGVFTLLWIMLQEPGHPGGFITLLVALAAWLGAECIRAGRPLVFAATLGTLGAVIALTKINVGAFLVIPAGLWLLLGLRPVSAKWAALPSALVALTLGLLPLALMRGLIDKPWVPTYAIVASLGGLGAAIVAARLRGRGDGERPLLVFIAAGLVATAAVACWAMLNGTSLDALLRGVVLEPMRHPGIYSFPVRWRPLVVPFALAALALTLFWAARPKSPAALALVAAARTLIIAGMLLGLLPWIGSSQAALALCYGVPAAGLFAIPLAAPDGDSEPRVRAWLALLLVTQSLQAFPIAGSQLNWGTFLWIPLLALGAVDTLRHLGEKLPPPRAAWLGRSSAGLALVFSLLPLFTLAKIARERRADGVALGLPGAERILLPPAIAGAVNVIAVNARENADMLFSLPGAFSFNQWTRLPTPGLRNVTHWFSLLGEEDQRAIAAGLEKADRPAFVLQRAQLVHLAQNGFPVRGPLVGHLWQNYREALGVDVFSLWTRPGAAFTPFHVLEATPAPSAPGVWRLSTRLAATTETVLAIEAYDTRLSAERGRVVLAAPRASAGDDARAVSFPLPAGPARAFAFDWTPPDPAAAALFVFRLAGADDRTVAFLRFPNGAEPLRPPVGEPRAAD